MMRKQLSRPQNEVIDALAHHMVMAGLSQNVEGMEGVLDHYKQTGQTAKQRQYVDALEQRIREVKRDMAAMLRDSNGSSK